MVITIKRKMLRILIAVAIITPFSWNQKVQAAEETIASVQAVNSSKPMMYIDNPVNNSTISNKNSFAINGWAVNSSGIKEVKIYVQDNFVGNATIGISRPDVKKVYPDYINADKSGYEYILNTAAIPEGTKAIKVQAIGNDGTTQESTVSVLLKKLQQMMYIDQPINDSTVKDNVTINGWALNFSGIKEVKIYVDGNYVGNATTGLSRVDVKQVYPAYKDADKSGYSYSLNTQNIPQGKRVVKVQAIGNDGSVQEKTTNITLEKLQSMAFIDDPRNDMKVRDNIVINGWALNASGVKEVKIYVDGNYVGNATTRVSRVDVKQVYPGYVDADKSGYTFNLNMQNISDGRKFIKVQAIGNDGSIKESITSITLEKLKPMMVIDEPRDNSTTKDNITVKGWVLNPSGTKEVKIYVDGTYIGNANNGISRPDVRQVFPEYINADKSGYEYTINTLTIAPGLREIKVQAVGNNGDVQEYNTKVNITKPNPKTYIDEPTVNSTLNNSVKISGWALNASGIRQIKVYLDNNYLGDAKSGISRLDVRQVYPEYINAAESGFEYLINTELVTQGTKTIKVQVIGNDGTQDIISFNVIINHSTTNYVTYPKSFNSYIDIQMEKKPLIQDKYTLLWRYATRDEVAYYMNPLNFINDSSGKYMFLKLNYTEGLQASQLNSVLKGKGVLEGKGEAFIEAGRRANINPIYLVAHALLETGNGTSTLARGAIKVDKIHEEFGNENSQLKSVEPKTIYNMYGIGALDKDANLWGSEKAYSEGWFTVEDAIIGGAKWIGSGYINSATYNQNTIYKMRWDFSTSSMWHQYATDVAWAYKQTSRIRSIVESMDDPIVHFEIPRFN